MAAFVRVTDGVLDRLLGDKNLRRQFLFLSDPPKLRAKRTNCGGCGNAPPPKPAVDTNALRKRITQVPAARLATIKTFLKTPELRVRYRDNKNRVIDKTL